MPKPSSARAHHQAADVVRERERHAAGTVTAIDTSMHRFGPKRSSATPSGNWVAAKQKK